jgi:putative ABC transport system ATP-binding protein
MTENELATRAAIVDVSGLTKVYGSGAAQVRALEAVHLNVYPGEFVAVMGPSGCGKSTLLNLLGRRRIGFVFQFFNLIPVLDAVENASLPLRLDGVRNASQRATTWLRRVGLGDRLHNRPDQLSGGEQQRVAVARALSTEPALVLADEPTGNLDSRSATEIGELLRQVSTEWGRSVLMVTHDPRVAGFAERLVLMKDGRVIDDFPLDGRREGPREALERSGLL